MEITSVNNELVKEIAKLQQKKYRQISEKFIIEGYKSIKEAFDFGIKIEKIFVEKCNVPKYNFAKKYLIETNAAVLKKISATDSTPEAVAVGVQKIYNIADIKEAKKVVLLENIRDLGNLGTIIRTCVAFGVDAIILYGECTDIYSPKVVRACVGNLWKIPIINTQNFKDLEYLFEKYERIATLPKGKNQLKNSIANNLAF